LWIPCLLDRIWQCCIGCNLQSPLHEPYKISWLPRFYPYKKLLKENKINTADQFKNLTVSTYYQHITLQPTMYTASNRPSLIDNTVINSLHFNAASCNLIAKITDHMPNFVILTKKINKNYKTKFIKSHFW